MGCVNSSWLRSSLDFLPWVSHQDNAASENSAAPESSAKQYSWDLKRQEVDVSKYIFEDTLDSDLVKLPGDINGKSYYEILN